MHLLLSSSPPLLLFSSSHDDIFDVKYLFLYNFFYFTTIHI